MVCVDHNLAILTHDAQLDTLLLQHGNLHEETKVVIQNKMT